MMENDLCTDTISRQAAIDAVLSNNHNHDITLVGDAYGKGYRDGYKTKQNDVIEDLAQLPHAHPEIVCCKDCQSYQLKHYFCKLHESDFQPYDFCSYGERKDGKKTC